MSLFRVFQERFVLFLSHAASFVNLSYDDARIDGINAHALRGEFERGATGQLIESGLGNAVGQNAGKRAQTGHT